MDDALRSLAARVEGQVSAWAPDADIEAFVEAAGARVQSPGRDGLSPEEVLASSGVPPRYCRKTLEGWRGFDILSQIIAKGGSGRLPYEDLGAWAAEDDREFMFLFGAVGVGKTHLGTAFFRRLVVDGALNGWWVGCSEFLVRLKTAIDIDQRRTPQRLGWNQYSAVEPSLYNTLMTAALTVPVLMLDDLGSYQATAYTDATISDILRIRYDHCRPTIVTGNLTEKDLNSIDVRIASRLLGSETVRVPLGGEDWRRK